MVARRRPSNYHSARVADFHSSSSEDNETISELHPASPSSIASISLSTLASSAPSLSTSTGYPTSRNTQSHSQSPYLSDASYSPSNKPNSGSAQSTSALTAFTEEIEKHTRTPSMTWAKRALLTGAKSTRIPHRISRSSVVTGTDYIMMNTGVLRANLSTIPSGGSSSDEDSPSLRPELESTATELASKLAMRPSIFPALKLESNNWWSTKHSMITAATLTGAALIGLNLSNVTSAISNSYSYLSNAAQPVYSSYVPSCVSKAAGSIYSYAPSMASIGSCINSYVPSKCNVLSELGWAAGATAVLGTGAWYMYSKKEADQTETGKEEADSGNQPDS